MSDNLNDVYLYPEEQRPHLEKGRYSFRNDPKWAHPEMAPTFDLKVGVPDAYGIIFDGYGTGQSENDISIPREERIAGRDKTFGPVNGGDLFPAECEAGTWKTYNIKGLHEGDPNFDVKILYPKNNKKKKTRAIFFVGQSGMMLNNFSLFESVCQQRAKKHNAIVVFACCRSGLDAVYPAPIDDYEATWRWMIENADELGINPNKVVINGESGGGYVALCFAFRCKNVGLDPAGCVVEEPITDDRMMYPSSQFLGVWDATGVVRTIKTIMREGDAFAGYAGPEYVPNHATVEDCRGLCPMSIHTLESDVDRDASIEFAKKCYAADVYTQLHVWAGTCHGSFVQGMEGQYQERFEKAYHGDIEDFLTYDLRRPWTKEK